MLPPAAAAVAAPPLDDENLLSEILLRLSPLPSSLPRASAVCKRWRRIVSDIRFFRRFREHHRRSPPLLGFFVPQREHVSYRPTMGFPDHVPEERFSLQLDDSWPVGCRHGLLLISHYSRKQLLVWDPVTGDQHHIGIPPGFGGIADPIRGAVLRAAGEADHFQVILVGGPVGVDKQHIGVPACVYSSETGAWDNLNTPPIPFEAYNTLGFFAMCFTGMSAVLVGNSLYWRLGGRSDAILEFDLERQSLAIIQVPEKGTDFTVMPTEGGGLGLFSISGFTAKLWKRKVDSDGLSSWVMGRTIELDNLLSLHPEEERMPPTIQGLAEYNNVVFLTRCDGCVIMLQLESLQFKKLYGISVGFYHHQFESVYSAGTSIRGEHDGAELLHNT